MNLISVYSRPDRAQILYELLGERDETVNISHKAMPSFDEHVRFIQSKPYQAWYFIVDERVVGSCYLSKNNEIGIQIFREHQGKGFGQRALRSLMARHGPELRYLANINPHNERSVALFAKLGFNLVQHTYARTPSR
jgi:RimJ/RimL family protein N-acetyltransferase